MGFYYYVSTLEKEIGDKISHQDLYKSPHKNFFFNLEEVPQKLRSCPDYLARRKAEIDLEEIRLNNFFNIPSRKDCIFLNKNFEDACFWMGKGRSRRESKIFKLRPISIENYFETNLVWFNYLVRINKNPNENKKFFSQDIEEEYNRSLLNYWESVDSAQWGAKRRIEILCLGTLEIVRIIKPTK